MEAKELMIGDWVKATYHLLNNDDITQTEQIISIDAVREGFIDCKPIPLTEEILLANGFYNDGSDNYNHPAIKNTYNGKFIDYLLNLHPKMIEYVHQLQHALRLCGLSDIADNFKIK